MRHRPDRPPSSWDVLRQALHDGFQNIDRRLPAPLAPNHFRLQEANPRWAHQVERGRFRAGNSEWKGLA